MPSTAHPPKRSALPSRPRHVPLVTALLALLTLAVMAWHRRARAADIFAALNKLPAVHGYSIGSDSRVKPASQRRSINRTGVAEPFTTVRTDWQPVVRAFMQSCEPELFSARLIRHHFYSDTNNVQATCMLVTISDGNVTFVERYHPARHSRAASVKYVLNRIVQQHGSALAGATFLVMLTDGHRPRVATFGSARHWKSWNRMIPVPLGNSRGSNVQWGTPFQGWDTYIDNTVVKTHSTYLWKHKLGKAVFRGSLCMQSYKLGSCNIENAARCTRATRWNQVNRGVLYEKVKQHPQFFDVQFTQHKLKRDAPADQFFGAPPLSQPMDFRHFQKYKYILNVGSNQDWAERLRSLLYMNSAVVMHQAETQEFFTPLLKPWIHYIPTDLHFTDLAQNVKWAQEHDDQVQQIVRNQNAFAHRYINERSMQQYWEVALKEFSERQAKAGAVGSGSVH